MAKVKIGFFCIKEKKTYAVGDEYTGKRTDINHLLEDVKEDKRRKLKLEKK